METSVLQAIGNGSAIVFGHWYPLEKLERKCQRILVWLDDGVHMAIAYRHDDPYFWSRVKAWMPFPDPPE